MASPFWDRTAQAGYSERYDPTSLDWRCTIGDQILPGFVEVDVSVEEQVDRQKPKGKRGAALTFHGRQPASLVIRLYLSHPDRWAAWQKMAPIVYPPLTGGEATAYDFHYPGTDYLRLRAVAVYSMSAVRPGRVAGEKMIEMRAVEFIKPDKRKSQTATIRKAKIEKAPVIEQLSDGNFTAADGTSKTVRPANYAPNPSTVTISPTT